MYVFVTLLGNITINVGNHQNKAFHSKSLDVSRPCISYVNICSIIVVVTVVVFVDLVVVNDDGDDDDDDEDDDINFPICNPRSLWTRRRHSQIHKEDHGPSISTCPAMDFVRIESLVLPNGKTCELIYVYVDLLVYQVFVPHCWTLWHIAVRFSNNRSGQFWTRFRLLCHSFMTVCTVHVLFLASVHRGIPLDIILYFIVETHDYANNMSGIDYLLIIYYK